MWIYFQSQDSFAIKVFVGEVNAVTGLTPSTKRAQDDGILIKDKAEQDYIVTPRQKWLDGIATSDGGVRQFTAMPSGENFVAGAELTALEMGTGLRFEIIPAKLATSTAIPFRISVRTPENRTVPLTVIRSDTIHIIKQQLWTSGEESPDLQVLSFEGRKLEDGRTLADYGIFRVSEVATPPLRRLCYTNVSG
jgi:hypothetical protein